MKTVIERKYPSAMAVGSPRALTRSATNPETIGWPGLDAPPPEEGAEPSMGSASREELGAVYDAILVEVVALSQAVDPPGHKTVAEEGEQEPQA